MRKYIWLALLFLINQAIIPQSWVELNSPFNSVVRVLHISNSNTLFAGGDSGFFSTNDEGATWDTILTAKTMSIYTQNDSTWFLCTYNGIYLTLDYGENWLPFGQTIPTLQINDMTINKNDNSLFASTDLGLYKSSDNGLTWNLLLNNYGYMVVSIGDTIIYLAKNGNFQKITRSTDNGSNWTDNNLGDFSGMIYQTTEGILFLEWHFFDTSRLYKSLNGGGSWGMIYQNQPSISWGPVISNTNNSLVMQRKTKHNLFTDVSLMVSFNNFLNSTVYNVWIFDVGNSSINSLFCNLSETIFAGLKDGKIRKISGIILTDIDEEPVNNPTQYRLNQNYPNPFNPSTKISWQSPVGSWQTIKLYNAVGQEVDTIIDGYFEAGSHSKLYIVNSKLPSGVYFYQLKAGDFVETKKMILLR